MPIRRAYEALPMKEKDAIRSAKMLIDIFEKNHIEYWFDYGALLGIIRSHKFIPWDTDIEPYIRYKDEKIPFTLIDELENKGFTVKICPFTMGYSKGIKLSQENGYVSMSIGFFRQTNLSRVLGLICYYLPTFLRLWIINFIQNHYSKSTNEKIRPKNQKDRDKGKISSYVRAMFPIFFCGKLKKVKFYDMEVSVPGKAEELLLMRYGKEWKIPRKVFESYTT